MVMSKETREDKEREFRIKASDFQALQKKYRSDLQDLERQLMGDLQKDISALVSEIGKKEGYQLVISSIGVLYSQPSIDITARLVQELNAAKLGAARKPENKPDDTGPCRQAAGPGRCTEATWKPPWTSWPSCGVCRTATPSC